MLHKGCDSEGSISIDSEGDLELHIVNEHSEEAEVRCTRTLRT